MIPATPRRFGRRSAALNLIVTSRNTAEAPKPPPVTDPEGQARPERNTNAESKNWQRGGYP